MVAEVECSQNSHEISEIGTYNTKHCDSHVQILPPRTLQLFLCTNFGNFMGILWILHGPSMTFSLHVFMDNCMGHSISWGMKSKHFMGSSKLRYNEISMNSK